MPKVKYKYDTETLSYKAVERTRKQLVLRSMLWIGGIVAVGLIFFAVLSFIVDTPEEKGLKREISSLLEEYNSLNNRLESIEMVVDDMAERDENIYRSIFAADPIAPSIRDAGYGGSNRYTDLKDLENKDIAISTEERLDKLTSKVRIQSISYNEVVDLAKEKEVFLKKVPAIQPISNKDLRRTASGWGYRMHPVYKIRKFHYGMDFTAPIGTEIYATGDGIICEVSSRKTGYGNKIMIDHGFGYKSLYGHMSKFNVKKGQEVKRGDVIGFVGSTGTSTGPHVHYEVWMNGKRVNPANFYFNDLTSDEFDRMIEISNSMNQTLD